MIVDIQQAVMSSMSHPVGRRLHEAGLHACRPLRWLPLTPRQKHQRLPWCRARLSWSTAFVLVETTNEWTFGCCCHSTSTPSTKSAGTVWECSSFIGWISTGHRATLLPLTLTLTHQVPNFQWIAALAFPINLTFCFIQIYISVEIQGHSFERSNM